MLIRLLGLAWSWLELSYYYYYYILRNGAVMLTDDEWREGTLLPATGQVMEIIGNIVSSRQKQNQV
jgi:hypothetical protein